MFQADSELENRSLTESTFEKSPGKENQPNQTLSQNEKLPKSDSSRYILLEVA